MLENIRILNIFTGAASQPNKEKYIKKEYLKLNIHLFMIHLKNNKQEYLKLNIHLFMVHLKNNKQEYLKLNTHLFMVHLYT